MVASTNDTNLHAIVDVIMCKVTHGDEEAEKIERVKSAIRANTIYQKIVLDGFY